MPTDTILHSWSDDHGDLYRVGRRGSQYFIETIAAAFTPRAGEVTRRDVSKDEAMNFDPDPAGEDLTFTQY